MVYVTPVHGGVQAAGPAKEATPNMNYGLSPD